jgi:hypothetical protein
MTLPKTYFFTDEVIDINLIIDNSKVPKVIKPFKVRLVATEYLDAPYDSLCEALVNETIPGM